MSAPNGGVELAADSVDVVGPCDNVSPLSPALTLQSHYPIQRKQMTLETLREVPHLRYRTKTFGAMARIRSEASFQIHNWFHVSGHTIPPSPSCRHLQRQHHPPFLTFTRQENGFHQVHAPVLTTSDCEGGGEAFEIFRPKTSETGAPIFPAPVYLTVSSQLHAECMALGLRQVYTFGPTFRAENSNTPRHLAEFWMLEPEIAFVDVHVCCRCFRLTA